ncbi:SusD/RagB family nutrient-binding outer membrane lipoprotein [Bacteroides thetaiotaomicron]|nr:SusD/RagB family nutrient-binding outer membrane lipoprotein [Bacteroides thetaiotaomicron]
MKRIIIKTIAAAALAPIFCGCTSNFEDYNTNPYQPHDLNPPMLYTTMITSGVNVQQNDNQMIDQMVGGPFGGYLSMSQDWGRVNNFYTYNADDNWNQIPFNTPFEKFYANYYRIQEATGEKGHFWAMAKLLRVNTMHRVTDAYGPIPYSQVSKGVAATPYDSQEDVYKHMFEDLDYAINILKEYVTETGGMKPLEGYDPVFNGDYSKWVRFANSMKLRLALRISSADPVLAQKKAEEAVADNGGLIETPSDNAMCSVGAEPNPYQLVANDWGEIRVNATIASYMNGYNDPRRSAYFTASTVGGNYGTYVGMRSGIQGAKPATYANFSKPKYEKTDPITIFYCSETAFLRAEGALKGWNMGGTAQHFYEEGIKLSFSERGISSNEAETYIKDTESTPAAFNSPVEPGKCSYVPKTTITVSWNEGASDAEKLGTYHHTKMDCQFPIRIRRMG